MDIDTIIISNTIALSDFSVTLNLKTVKSTDLYILKSADGLGPPDFSTNYGPFVDGRSIFQGVSPQGREITLRLALNPKNSRGWSISQLRDYLYRTMSLDGNSGLRIFFGKEGQPSTAYVRGFVSGFETNIFSKNTEVAITIKTESAYLEALSSIKPNLSGTNPNGLVVNNPGTAPAPFSIRFKVTSAATSIKLWIENTTTPELKFEVWHTIPANLIFHYVNAPSLHQAYYFIGTDWRYYSSEIDRNSTWFYLPPGTSKLRVNTPVEWDEVTTGSGLDIWPRYWGI